MIMAWFTNTVMMVILVKNRIILTNMIMGWFTNTVLIHSGVKMVLKRERWQSSTIGTETFKRLCSTLYLLSHCHQHTHHNSLHFQTKTVISIIAITFHDNHENCLSYQFWSISLIDMIINFNNHQWYLQRWESWDLPEKIMALVEVWGLENQNTSSVPLLHLQCFVIYWFIFTHLHRFGKSDHRK